MVNPLPPDPSPLLPGSPVLGSCCGWLGSVQAFAQLGTQLVPVGQLGNYLRFYAELFYYIPRHQLFIELHPPSCSSQRPMLLRHSTCII
jgi:hypothetical protein